MFEGIPLMLAKSETDGGRKTSSAASCSLTLGKNEKKTSPSSDLADVWQMSAGGFIPEEEMAYFWPFS